ncbi:DNA-binding protein [Pseudoxanthomonas sp. PXM02]|uniref:DNA-binding protein n=1 Tax=Pseudoxanthomonas sp. PXM02 TaxID=2769294 RepID=UPI00177AC1D9|nr:DNA-binding protein [Pseudoxanthomonas sp. PXM02]MBD9478534.1 DNA-binding protein [Pseudoxanthomonas sp. PXM02]
MSTRNARRKPSRSPALRTADQAKEWLRTIGLSASQFARDNQLSLDAVKDVLGGRSKANFGSRHDAAVALGMKPNPQIPTVSRQTARRG